MAEVIDELWDRLWAAGITSAVTAVEQVSYLLLLRRLDFTTAEQDGSPFALHPKLRWDVLREASAETRFATLEAELMPFLKSAVSGGAFSEALRGAAFALPGPAALTSCLAAFDTIEQEFPERYFGSVPFEQLLERLQVSGREGQTVTPRPLVEVIIELLDPKPGEVVCDPTAGTAGFLVEAFKTASARDRDGRIEGADFRGTDVDPGMVRLGCLNLALHGVDPPTIWCQDALEVRNTRPFARVVVANPPFATKFTGRRDPEDFGLGTTRIDVIVLELCRQMLAPHGRAAVIVPQGLLFSRERAQVEVRRRWLTEGTVDAVVSLPGGAFGPATDVRTAIILGRAGGPTEEVLFCSIEDLDRARVSTSELRYMSEAIRAHMVGEAPASNPAKSLLDQWHTVPIGDIAERGWDLSASAYLEIEAPMDETADPLRLLDEVAGLESQVQVHLEEARRLLERDG